MSELKVSNLTVSTMRLDGADDFLPAAAMATILGPRNSASGEAVFTTPGTFQFIVPEGVIKISAVAVGAGGGGNYDWANRGGGGGALAWADNIPVTTGQVINVTVPGVTTKGSVGGDAIVGSFFTAKGGEGVANNSFHTGGSPVSGTVPARGGKGGNSSTTSAGGGGGAGGYSGPGGNGYYGASGTPPYNGSGGAAAGSGGYDSSTYGFGGGGGVGIFGEGASGVWGSLPNQSSSPINNGNTFYTDLRYAGAAGSDGEHGAPNSNSSTTSNKGRVHYHGEGGNYGGGGGGGGTSVSTNGDFCRGAQGAVRIVWSTDPSFSIAK